MKADEVVRIPAPPQQEQPVFPPPRPTSLGKGEESGASGCGPHGRPARASVRDGFDEIG